MTLVGFSRQNYSLALRLPRASSRAFTLVELMIVVSIMGLVAAFAVPEAYRSLQRSKLNEIALELAGWFESIKVNSTSDVTCRATFQSGAAQPFGVGNVLYAVSSIQQSGIAGANLTSPPCTQYIQDFRVSLSGVSGAIRVSSPASLQFTRRGTLIAKDATGAEVASDIRIFLVGSSYMRCLRPAALLGNFRIGANSNATSIADTCAENSFQAF